MPTGWRTFLTGAPHSMHSARGSSDILCSTSKTCPFSHLYSEIGIFCLQGWVTDSSTRIIQSQERLPGLPDPPLARAARGRSRVEVARGEVLLHALAGGLDEAWTVEYVLDLLGRGVATDVLFPQHVPEVRPIPDAMDDVLDHLALPLVAGPGVEDPVPKGPSLLRHVLPPFTLVGSATLALPKCSGSMRERTGPDG